MCEFALNSTESALGSYASLGFFGHEPVLPLEHAVHEVIDCPVWSVVGKISDM